MYDARQLHQSRIRDYIRIKHRPSVESQAVVEVGKKRKWDGFSTQKNSKKGSGMVIEGARSIQLGAWGAF